MRELVFTLEYEPGCNAVADTLAAHPNARIRSLSLHATPQSLWRVDHVSGSVDATTDLKDTFVTTDYYADCLATTTCQASQTTQVLEHTDGRVVLYSYWERTPTCASIPHIAIDHLGDGLLFETRHEHREYTWRIIHPGAGDVRDFFDELDAEVDDCGELEIVRLTDATSSTHSDVGGVDGLSHEQRTALRAAVEHGYYETPRRVSAGELADLLDVPRSTLTYRLRRAEAHLANQYVRFQPRDGTPPVL